MKDVGMLSVVLLGLGLVGCAPQVTVYPLTDLDGRAPTTRVDVYPHPDSLTRPHREIAILSATANERVHALDDDRTQWMDALRQKAQAIGADAIVVFRSSDPTLLSGEDDPNSRERIDQAEGRRDAGTFATPRSLWTIRVKAIVYEPSS